MFGAKYLLVVVEVCVLFEAVYSEGPCNTARYGPETDRYVSLPAAILPAGIRRFRVEIPNVCNPVGVIVTVCDYDSAPEVNFISTRSPTVVRTGHLYSEGFVSVALYCPQYWTNSKLKGETATLTVKAIPESPSGRLNTQQSTTGRSSEALLATLDQARLQNKYRIYRSDQDTQALDGRQTADIVRQAISTNARQVALEQARNQALNGALLTAQTVDGRQEADIVRSAIEANARQDAIDQSRRQGRFRTFRSVRDTLAAKTRQSADIVRKANIRQAALDQARQQNTHETRHAYQTNNALRNILRESTQRRTRRASKSSETSQAVDLVREAKADKTRQVVLDRAQQQTFHDGRLVDPILDAQRKNHLTTQKRSRRALLSFDKRQAADDLQNALVTNARQASLEQVRNQAINEALRSAQIVDDRQAADVVRQAIKANARQAGALDQARRQALILNGRTSELSQSIDARQGADIVREAIATNMRKSIMKQAHNPALNEALRTAQAIDGRQGANVVREALATNARQAALEKARIEALIEVFRSAHAINGRQDGDIVREALVTTARQVALEQAQNRALNEALLTAQTVDFRQGADIVRSAIEANVRQDAIDQSRRQGRFRKYRSVQDSQAANTRQSDDIARKAQQSALGQIHRQQELLKARLGEKTNNARRKHLRKSIQRSIRHASQSSYTSQAVGVVREAKADNTHQAELEQAKQQVAHDSRLADPISDAQRKNQLLTTQKRSRRALLSFDNRQAADGFEKALEANARQVALEQARNQVLSEALDNAQIVDGRQATDVVRMAIAANALQAATLDQARRQALKLTGRTSELSQSIDARQGYDIVREAKATNERQAALEQARNQALNEALLTAQTVDGRQGADIVRDAIEANARQAALDLSRLQNRYRIYRSARDTQAANTQQQETNEARLANKTTNSRRHSLRKLNQRNVRRASQSFDTSQTADVVRDAKADKAHQAVLDQTQQQAAQAARLADPISDAQRKDQLLKTQKRTRRAVSFDNREATDGLQRALATNTRRAFVEQAHNQALKEALRTDRIVDTRQATDMVREATAAKTRQAAALDQARRQALQLTGRTSELSQLMDTRQATDLVRDAIEANARKSVALDEARRQAIQLMSHTAEIGQGFDTRHANEVVRDAQTDKVRQAADLVREAIAANAPQAVALDQARRQVLQKNGRTSKFSQGIDARLGADVVRKIMAANARQAALIQAQGAQRSAQPDQAANERQRTDAQMGAVEEEASRNMQYL